MEVCCRRQLDSFQGVFQLLQEDVGMPTLKICHKKNLALAKRYWDDLDSNGGEDDKDCEGGEESQQEVRGAVDDCDDG